MKFIKPDPKEPITTTHFKETKKLMTRYVISNPSTETHDVYECKSTSRALNPEP